MKNHPFKSVILLVAILFTTTVFAQDWVRMMQNPEVNFFDTQKEFKKYCSDYTASYKLANNGSAPAKIPGYKIFKRWEHFMAPRVSPTGERFAPNAVWNAMTEYKKGYDQTMAGNWTFMGPSNTSSLMGAGRLNFVRVHPTNSNIIYVGAPAGGLWVSTNGGTSWTTSTDNLPQVIGCNDLAFDPTNPNTMYLATGDADGGDNYSVGLLKSTDGGVTWNTTGLTFTLSSYRLISRVLIDPTNANTIYVATSAGVYKSTNAGSTFTVTQVGAFNDMEFKPGTPSTIYVCGTELYRSTNSGTAWTKITSVLPPAANVARMAIAVTAADPNYLYLVAMKATTYDMEGFYKSINGGTSFTKPSAPAIGNQGFYDLCIAACPTNAQEVMIGGQVEFLKSTNAGTAWSQIATNTHVDYHDVVYTSGTTVYLTSDGGIWKSTNNGTSWSNLSNNLAISQMYGFGQSVTNPNLTIQGWQDNGTNIYNGTWQNAMGGDGMLAFISHGSDNTMWGSQYDGSLNRSTSGGASWIPMVGITETCPWVTEWNEDPITAGTVYAGCANVWKATAGTFTKLGNVAGSSTVTITAVAVSPANAQIMWTAKGGVLYKSTNAGAAWTAVSGLPLGTITDIVCHNTDVNKAWVTYAGFTNINKVFQTTNQGTSWTNISASLPNISINCMVNDKNGNDALYVGTDNGVYFKDASMTVWQPFSTNLPNVLISQLDIFYPSGGKLRATTYGRGMWETTLYTPGAYVPDANFGANNVIGCPGLGVQFADYSSGQPTSWSWSFPGGNPSTSTAQNPFVAYNTPGTYSVTLTASNVNGTNAQTFASFITVSSSQAAPTASGQTVCGPATVNLTATPSAPGTVRWWDQPAGGNLLATGNTYSPLVSGTTSFYVDETFSTTSIDFVGEVANTIGAGAMFTANDIRGLYFDVTQPVIINSVKVYSQTAGMRTIEILDGNGNFITDTTLNIPASPTSLTTVNINRKVYPGTNYFIKFRGMVDCYRNSGGATYPYVDGGSNAVTITNSNAGLPGYYYFFYDWQFTNIICNTGRTTVVVTDNCATGINDLFVTNQLDIYPNPNNGTFTLSFNTEKADNYTVKITNTIGQTIYDEKLNDFSGSYSNKIDISSFRKGVYMLSVSNSKNETVKKVLVH